MSIGASPENGIGVSHTRHGRPGNSRHSLRRFFQRLFLILKGGKERAGVWAAAHI
jgi:hypothetical protein